jgi:hypothetical protein
MTDSSAAELLEELNSKRRLTPFLPFAVALAVILVLSAVLAVIRGGSWWISALLAVAGVSLPIITSFRDQLRKTVVVFYELEGDAEEGYQRLHDAFDSLTACSRAWHVEAAGSVGQRKYHAGATTAVRRQPITVARRAIPYLKTNVDIPTIPVGKQLLAFMPERLLVVDSTACGAVPYSELLLDVAQTRFVEDGAVAGDAQVVDQTWKYVNKKGGPDRRFKDNRQLPVVLYDELHFSSSSGLNEIIQLSRCDVGAPFKAAVLGLARSAKAV